MISPIPKVAFIGFGEAAQAFSKGFIQDGHAVDVYAFDIKTDGPNAAAKHAEYETCGVTGEATCANACSDRDVIFSLVTADQAGSAAKTAAAADLNGALYLDCNSCAPNSKRRSADIIDAAGGRYVDVAVMSPVQSRLHKAPCLLAGPYAAAARDVMQDLGMDVDIAGEEIGDASTRKMIRSVMIKGLEALTLECFLAARAAGIETDILASLEASFPGFDWNRRAPYMMERAATHGIRRAAEMEEVAKTLSDLGLAPLITEGTVARQREVGALGLTTRAEDAQDLAKMADTILNGLAPQTRPTNKEE